ncbi:MAG TPA: S41 family peptidase [Flavobacterium sp.]|jgi:carboxyl-terminal processing protease
MKSNSIYLPIIIFTCIALGIVIGNILDLPESEVSAVASSHRTKLNRLIDFIESEYVDDINTDSIVDLTVNNILAKLDPHSVYIPPSEQSEVAEYMKGDFVGIGVNFYVYNDTVAIIKPIENGPSERAGLKAGDRILYAGNVKLFGRNMPTDSLFSILKGKENTQLELTIFRKSENKKLKVKVNRAVIPIKSVEAAVMLNPTTAYIKINRFAQSTYDEFRIGLNRVEKQGAKSLILDLRDNGGGYMEKAIEVADEFLQEKELIVFTKNKKGRIDKTYATTRGSFENGTIYILINENSASASEIIAGAIQDNDRGIIVGRRSFGKGLVQREMSFDDGSAVRLTIARYFTPSGRSIQKHYDKGNDEYFSDFERRFESGELYKKDSIKISDTLKFKTKKGRIVYGGGGIVPDIFVPLAVEHGQESITYLMQAGGIVGHFAFEQIDKNRQDFKNLTYDRFLQKMETTDKYLDAFQEYLIANGLQIRLAKNKELVRRYLTAEFARQLFSEDKYFQITIKEDPMIKAVLGE